MLKDEYRNKDTTSINREADVIVVGSGAAAFSAAVTVRRQGTSVIMLEKDEKIGGTTKRSGGGYWIPLNKWQKEAGYEDNREDCIRYMARYPYPNLYNPDAQRYGIPQPEFELLEAYVDNAHVMASNYDEWGALHSIMEVNWTGKGQVDYQDHLPENKGIRGRVIYPRDEEGNIMISGAELIRQLETWAGKNYIEIITNAEVNSILRTDTGKVNGVTAIINEREHIFQAGLGVIFGTGGYSHNPEYMLHFQRGPHYGGCSVPTNTGDFIKLAGSIGARIGNTPGAFRTQSLIESHIKYPGGISGVFFLPGDSMILVNKFGKRIVNEKRNYADRTMAHFHWDPVGAEWVNMLVFMIFDERTATLWQGIPPLRTPDKESPYLIKGDDLDELGQNIAERLERLAPYTGNFMLAPSFGTNLKETFERFNKFAITGKDEDFQRGDTNYDREWAIFPPSIPDVEWPPKDSKNYTMYPLGEKGPYFAYILAAGTLDTNGGPVINKHAQVIDWNNRPIPGLYGAGNCIAGPTANAYWGGGCTIGPALTFGYIAGNHIIEK